MSGLVPIGTITIASGGTPVALATARIPAQTIAIFPGPGNAGVVYVGLKGMDKSTGAGVLGVIAKPASATTGPFTPVVLTCQQAPAGLNLADLYVDGTTNDTIVGYALAG